MTNYPATIPVATVEELSRAYKLERLVAPYVLHDVTELGDETFDAIERWSAGRALRAPAMTRSPLTGHVLGAIYWSRYWHDHYTVKSIDERGFVTVRWHGSATRGDSRGEHTTTHCTNVRDDELVGSTGWWM